MLPSWAALDQVSPRAQSEDGDTGLGKPGGLPAEVQPDRSKESNCLSASSLMLSGGVPIEVVQMILGHSSPAVTRQVYAHLMRRDTAEQIEAATQPLAERRREQSVSKGARSAGPGSSAVQP